MRPFSYALDNYHATENKNQRTREFKNQGEQEDYWIEQIFQTRYSKKNFEKFNGDIVLNGDGFTLDDKTFVIFNTAKELLTIFSSGLFYPNIITGDTKSVLKSQAELDTLSAEHRFFYNMTRTDSLTISDSEEWSFLSKSPKCKRFRFWRWQKGFANPTVYFIELTNETATEKTDFPGFISGASLTFFTRDGSEYKKSRS